VRAMLAEGVRADAILLPQQALIRDAQGNAAALVVDENQTATLRPLRVGRSVAGNWLVESGLQPGDVVVLDGLQKVQPGSRVAPVQRPVEPAAVAGAAAH
jgi:membrane fusion protein, multidrug efflux system